MTARSCPKCHAVASLMSVEGYVICAVCRWQPPGAKPATTNAKPKKKSKRRTKGRSNAAH